MFLWLCYYASKSAAEPFSVNYHVIKSSNLTVLRMLMAVFNCMIANVLFFVFLNGTSLWTIYSVYKTTEFLIRSDFGRTLVRQRGKLKLLMGVVVTITSNLNEDTRISPSRKTTTGVRVERGSPPGAFHFLSASRAAKMLAILSVLCLHFCCPVYGVFYELYCSISDSCECDFKPKIRGEVETVACLAKSVRL